MRLPSIWAPRNGSIRSPRWKLGCARRLKMSPRPEGAARSPRTSSANSIYLAPPKAWYSVASHLTTSPRRGCYAFAPWRFTGISDAAIHRCEDLRINAQFSANRPSGKATKPFRKTDFAAAQAIITEDNSFCGQASYTNCKDLCNTKWAELAVHYFQLATGLLTEASQGVRN